jgi:hypothetical protein
MFKVSILALLSVGTTIGLIRADERPLVVAKQLARTRFQGWTYGNDASKRQIDCVQFVLAVVEGTIHRRLETQLRTRILISDLADAAVKDHGYAIVINEDPRTKGVQEALVQAGLGRRVDPKDAQPGDLIQYWMQQRSGTWVGHSAIIESVWHSRGDVRATLFGAHHSTSAIATSQFQLALVPSPTRKVYIVRLK